MNAAVKALLIVSFVVVLAVGALVAAVYTGIVPNPVLGGSDSRVLVIVLAPDEEGTDLAVAAFAVEPSTGSVTLLSTLESATVPGTSAASAREALPFGGGAAVSRALASQTDGTALDWVIVPAETWSAQVDVAGGISVDVPSPLNAYENGELLLIPAGPQKLTGAQAAAVSGSVVYFGDVAIQREVLEDVTAGVSAVLTSGRFDLREAVESGEAVSSLEPRDVPALDSRQ